MKKRYEIKGSEILSLEDFYNQFRDVFCEHLSYQMGNSLDALFDVLFAVPACEIVWSDSAQSRENLGFETTKQWLKNKLNQPHFNQNKILKSLEDLENHAGQTLFDIILEIFSEHQQIILKLE